MITPASPQVLPKETAGEDDPEHIFASVGRALSQWETLQLGLAFLFLHSIGAIFKYPALRAFGHTMLVTTKLDLIEYAVEASLNFHKDLHNKVKQFVGSVRGYNDRRNDIAHGTVTRVPDGFYLMPAPTTSKKYKAFSGLVPEPTYCWTSAQIDRYGAAFSRLGDECAVLSEEVKQVTDQYVTMAAREYLQPTSSLGGALPADGE